MKPDTLHRSGPTLRVGKLPYGSSESTTSRNDSGKPAGAFLASDGRFLDTKIRRGYCIAFEAGDEVNLTKQESNGLFVCLRRVGFGSDLCFWTLAAWLTEAQL